MLQCCTKRGKSCVVKLDAGKILPDTQSYPELSKLAHDVYTMSH